MPSSDHILEIALISFDDSFEINGQVPQPFFYLVSRVRQDKFSKNIFGLLTFPVPSTVSPNFGEHRFKSGKDGMSRPFIVRIL